MKPRSALIAAAILAAYLIPAQAHHSSAPHFDMDKEIAVSGVVTELKFVNPHAYIYFDVEQDGQVNNWRCELPAATILQRNGWVSDTFTPGQKISLVGTPAWREDHVCYMRTITVENGVVVPRMGALPEGFADEVVGVLPLTVEADESRPDYLPNGMPNIAGNWVSLSFGRNNTNIGQGARYVASEAGIKAAEGYEVIYDDPILMCHPVNIFNGWNHDRHTNAIYVEDDQIILQYGFMDLRRVVHLNMDSHPDNIEPSVAGHSIGRWEGDKLVVDTIGFEAGRLSRATGMMHSDQMHTVEHFYIDQETGNLMREYWVNDPLYLAEPAHGLDGQGLSASVYEPYNCLELSGENNIRPE